MISQDVLRSCQKLFCIKSFVAAGILPALRIEDAKIALYKRLHAGGGSPFNENQEAATDFMQSYDILARYIAGNNRKAEAAMNLAASGADGTVSKQTLFYKGKIPLRKLRFASYLYYKGVISNAMLMKSLVWQKERRALFGQIAMQIGHLKTEDFAQIMLAVRKGECFGAVARKGGLISEATINSILEIQKMYNCKIGIFFVEKGFLAAERVKELEQEMQSYNARFGAPG